MSTFQWDKLNKIKDNVNYFRYSVNKISKQINFVNKSHGVVES